MTGVAVDLLQTMVPRARVLYSRYERGNYKQIVMLHVGQCLVSYVTVLERMRWLGAFNATHLLR